MMKNHSKNRWYNEMFQYVIRLDRSLSSVEEFAERNNITQFMENDRQQMRWYQKQTEMSGAYIRALKFLEKMSNNTPLSIVMSVGEIELITRSLSSILSLVGSSKSEELSGVGEYIEDLEDVMDLKIQYLESYSSFMIEEYQLDAKSSSDFQNFMAKYKESMKNLIEILRSKGFPHRRQNKTTNN